MSPTQDKEELQRSTRMRKQFKNLDREMEVAGYAKVGISRVSKRKTPKKQMGERTKKRKTLEKEDFQELEEEVDHCRLRGSKAAMEEKLVQDSFVFQRKDDDQEEINLHQDDDYDIEDVIVDEIEAEEDIIESGDDEDHLDDDEYIEEGNGIFPKETEVSLPFSASPSEGPRELGNKTASLTTVAKSTGSKAEITSGRTTQIKSSSSGKRKRRKLYRMKNFKSYKMAQRHGEALGAHAKGLPQLAIEKLEKVAEDAPLAPQVYTSLGMVYEDMLRRDQQKKEHSEGAEYINSAWMERLELAKKAYASYHTAAVLCKKDYMVWVRAGDAAREVRNIYEEAMLTDKNRTQKTIEDYRALKLHWVQEAQKDYQAADNLKKAGIDIPAKLAETQMELGNLSEALAILTDLKKQPHQTYRTWMLYADLMLRIGFECTQWNNGDQLNENYMFRRWLRKYSRLFDWQERRLQALALALEAAAGSDSCQRLVNWATSRVKHHTKEKNDNHIEMALGAEEDTYTCNESNRWYMDPYECEPRFANGGMHPTPNSTQTPHQGYQICQSNSAISEKMLEAAKKKLIAENKAELEAFDKEWEHQALAYDESLNNRRENERAKLKKNQRKRLFDLVSSSLSSKRIASKNEVESASKRLPISASCSVVCSIASELLKHCLGLELFEGGRLVAESVSSYLRRRSDMCEKRRESMVILDKQMRSTSNDVLLRHECYDEGSDDSTSDNEGPFRSLSDDETFEKAPEVVSHLRKGILPPEIQVLYALCIIGEGGKDYLASKLIKSLANLPDVTHQNPTEEIVDTDIKSNTGWFVYRCAMTDELSRIPALAFVSDFLRKVDRDAEWASIMIPIFSSAVELMEASGDICEALSKATLVTPNQAMSNTQVVKIVLAEARFRMVHCQINERNWKSTALTTYDTNENIVNCFDHVMNVLSRVWKIEDGIPSKSSVEALQIMSCTCEMLEFSKLDPMKHLERLQKLVGVLIGSKFDIQNIVTGDSRDKISLKSLPVCGFWQNEGQKALSRFAHNLCASCNVTLFSGWESDEFNLNLIRRTGKSGHFGITLHKRRVIGHLDRNVCDKLAEIWLIVGEKSNLKVSVLPLINEASTFLEQEGVFPPEDDGVVTKYAEKEALSIIIEYAKKCFVVSCGDSESTKRNQFETGMSLLLPITQFCTVQQFWESEIGLTTTMAPNVDIWFSAKAGDQTQVSKTSYKPPARTKKLQPSVTMSMKEQFWNKADVKSMPNYIPVSVRHLNAAWRIDCQQSLPHKPSKKEISLQLELDERLSTLRTKPSEIAVQKKSLPVTLALIDIIPHAQNPFLVMQHAAMFASQCAKGGQMDLYFKTELPCRKKCTPLQAIEVLTRADCLAAVHFTQEAMFLCCHVVRICRSRRQEKRGEKWTARWEVVGICTYNTAINIRHATFNSFLSKDEISKSLEAWKDELLTELDFCRLDATRMHEPFDKLDNASVEDENWGDVDRNNDNHNAMEELSAPEVFAEASKSIELAESVNEVVPV